MQSFTKGTGVAITHQHEYVKRGTLFSLRTIYGAEGFKGLWRGSQASMLRTGIGSSVQIPCYELVKGYLLRKEYFEQGMHIHFVSSLATGLVLCTVMNPFDVAMTRMYNQKDASVYKNVVECLYKTVKIEGPAAIYKGYWAHYLRIG
jgi:solute carrier family 25, member 34/35